ncbi:hypothetical protein GN244_ATG19350 [Phytophthora infestans]|uniref:Uncharacterized protein n=1 Tax=Phytophthora infestans TaxID=4787 RepID=A0A833W456_PHYIN|nr:hypothetical protein GN244_ATG19350 [Phytophthora infestans]
MVINNNVPVLPIRSTDGEDLGVSTLASGNTEPALDDIDLNDRICVGDSCFAWAWLQQFQSLADCCATLDARAVATQSHSSLIFQSALFAASKHSTFQSI